MDEELNLDLGEDKSKEIISRKDKKIDSLSEKLGLTEKEKAELAEAKAKAEADAAAALKDAEFYKNFNSLSSKYPNANEFQDKIREKVAAGYELEDAAISILAKEGKYTAPAPEKESPIGGSAATGIHDAADKPLGQRTREELRSALEEQIAKGEFKL